MVVAGVDADRRRVEPDEQQPVAQRRQVRQRLDALAVDRSASRVRTRSGPLGERGQLLRRHGRWMPAADGTVRRAAACRPGAGGSGGGGASGAVARAWISAWALAASVFASLTPVPRAAPDFGSVLGPRHDHDDDEDDDQDEQDVGRHARMVRPACVSAGGARPGSTRRSAVWVAENEATLLSTSRASLAASMTSTSRRVAALPLRETTQIAPFSRIRVARSRSGASCSIESAPKQDDVGVGLRPALGHVGRPVGDQRADRVVLDVDERDAHPRPDAELVEQRGGVDAFHGRYRGTHAARVRAALGHLRLRAGPPADAAPVRTGDRPAARGRRGARAWRPSRPRTTSSSGATTRRYIEVVQAVLGAPFGPPRGRDRRGRRRPAVRRDARRGGDGRRRLDPGDGGDPPRRRRARVPPGRRAPSRDARPGLGLLHLRRRRRSRSRGRGATACASCTSTSTSTTATASRRSTGTTRAS